MKFDQLEREAQELIGAGAISNHDEYMDLMLEISDMVKGKHVEAIISKYEKEKDELEGDWDTITSEKLIRHLHLLFLLDALKGNL